MKISYIYVSHRPGGIHLLPSWLADQRCDGVEYELIVVDGLMIRIREGKAKSYLSKSNVNLAWYGEPKPRTYQWSSLGYANAINTGLIHATGSHVVVIHDFIKAHPDYLTNWHNVFQSYPNAFVCGNKIPCSTPDPEGIDDVATWENTVDWVKIDRPENYDFKLGFWGGSMSLFETCNGLDERSDFCHGWALNDVKAKANALGALLVKDMSIQYLAADHRSWYSYLPSAQQSTVYRSMPIPDVPYEPRWTTWSANDFVLTEERRRAANA